MECALNESRVTFCFNQQLATNAKSTFKLNRNMSRLLSSSYSSYFEKPPGMFSVCLGKVVRPLQVKTSAFSHHLLQDVFDCSSQ